MDNTAVHHSRVGQTSVSSRFCLLVSERQWSSYRTIQKCILTTNEEPGVMVEERLTEENKTVCLF